MIKVSFPRGMTAGKTALDVMTKHEKIAIPAHRVPRWFRESRQRGGTRRGKIVQLPSLSDNSLVLECGQLCRVLIMVERVKLRDLKNADTRARKQKQRIEEVAARQGKKYPQKASSTTIPSKGDLACSMLVSAKVATGIFDRLNQSADRLGLSKAQWLRQAIDRYLELNGD